MNMAHLDWIERAGRLFRAPRPEHFTQFDHCCECEDHDRTLLGTDIDTISIAELGNPGWDPICFTTAEGKKYYLPAFIRLSLETMKDEFYLAQFLFHLEGDGSGNEFYMSCNEAQRRYVASFLEYVIEHYSDEIEAGMCAEDSLRSYQIWSGQ